MFSGIIEQQSEILNVLEKETSVQITVRRPKTFEDIKLGDSIATNGVCLTVENLQPSTMQFTLGQETLRFLDRAFIHWKILKLNLERSLKFGDRIHGHLVTGHVDQLGEVIESFASGECWLLKIKLTDGKAFVWKKGSIAVNGISLTVNDVETVSDGLNVSVCLIPETIKNTNLADYRTGDLVMIETDYLAKAYFSKQSTEKPI